MASKVLVKIPVAPFAHVNKPASEVGGVAELVAVGSTSRCTDPLLRVAQLEQNIRFLQDQHQQMLSGLHQEIEGLRQRNRDLQFQLVFSKGSIASPNSASPSSPDDDSKTRVLSPKQVNVTPLQVELLERELGELKITLHEVNQRNAYLTAIVDEQKKKLERVDNSPSPDLLAKLDDVESLVRKLRRENDELRREVSDSRAVPGSNQGQQREHRGRHRGHYRGHRFPPLHSQSYWRDKDGEGSGTVLPSLNMNHTQVQNQQQQPQHTSHGHYSGGKRSGNNNHHQYQGNGGGGGKYRGSQSRGHKS